MADPDKALQQLAEEAERIDPAAQDAVSRLRAVVRGLIEVERARAREIAALRATKRTRSASSGSRKRSRKAASPAAPGAPLSPPAGTASEPDQTAAAAPNPATAGMLFGKRGLKKVHRPGCVFGERIRAEDRVYFKRLEEATAAGYEPCKICRPGG